ncbi:MAG: hypothetical protein KKA79_08410, partial [Nanoarchaeota archaeon]|nr:hypothetical protein [Nanoarchaeota archaeon]
ILVMMVHGIGGPHEINYEEFKQKTKEHTKYKVKDYGKYFEITTKYDRLLVIKAQEIGTKEKKDVLAIGSDKIIKPEQDLEKAIEDIHHNNGIAIIAHPMSVIKNNFLRFGIANKEDKETLEPACYQADAMEEFNSLNQFWMYPSNVSAKHFVEEKGLVGTAGSDSHGNLNTIGLAGIIIKKDYIDINNLIENLREVIRNKDFKTHKEYASPKTFYDNLIGPKIKKKGFSGFFKKR